MSTRPTTGQLRELESQIVSLRIKLIDAISEQNAAVLVADRERIAKVEAETKLMAATADREAVALAGCVKVLEATIEWSQYGVGPRYDDGAIARVLRATADRFGMTVEVTIPPPRSIEGPDGRTYVLADG